MTLPLSSWLLPFKKKVSPKKKKMGGLDCHSTLKKKVLGEQGRGAFLTRMIYRVNKGVFPYTLAYYFAWFYTILYFY